MTDEQIIKADEQIIKALEHNASKCKFYEDGHDGGLFESTLDLIKRYKSENEELRKRISYLEESVDCSREEYNRLLLQKLQQAKSEALMHAFSKFAGHSDYHGDTILCQLACMAEGKETKSAIPIDMNQIRPKAIKEFAERLKGYPIVENESKEIAYLFVEVRDIDNLVKEMTE